jgi:hypothetical protein
MSSFEKHARVQSSEWRFGAHKNSDPGQPCSGPLQDTPRFHQGTSGGRVDFKYVTFFFNSKACALLLLT